MFPTSLDGAKVIYYTPKNNYGTISFPDGKTADTFTYLAICKYEKDINYIFIFLQRKI